MLELIIVAGAIFHVISWVMLFSKKRYFVREMEKDIEICLWVAKWWSFKIRDWESDG